MFSNNRLEHNIPWLDHIRSHPASHRPHPYQGGYLLRWGRNNNNLNRIKQHQGEADVKTTENDNVGQTTKFPRRLIFLNV